MQRIANVASGMLESWSHSSLKGPAEAQSELGQVKVFDMALKSAKRVPLPVDMEVSRSETMGE